MKKEVLCLGHVLYDSRNYIKEFPKKDKTAIVNNISCSVGGSATNTSIDLAILGMESRIVGSVGNDELGSFVLRNLKKYGVDVKYIKLGNGKTGHSTIVIDKNGDVKIYEYVGVSDNPLKPNKKMFAGVNHLHMSGYAIPTIKNFAEFGKNMGVQMSLDPGRFISHQGHEKMKAILKKIDYLFLNKHELLELYPHDDICDALENLGDIYDLSISVKLGSEGVMGYEKNNNKIYTVKKRNVKAVDTVGAGDSYDAGFLFYLLNGKSFKESLDFGNKVAAINVTCEGTHTIPHWKKVDSKLKSLERN
ncbi:carbohydrate kinase family protein [Candidatus Micrarchaeota archaeon]|jgi:ribokinase|nr:carbohydrate kinase family protein [Candidatus Micrarchaeota archaeon]